MQEADLVAKMLRAVLQSHKTGVPFSCLQGEYKSLTGDWIPFKQLGHATLESYLKSIPGVVRIEIGRSGEISCHAVVCQETAKIAQLVACQRTSKRKLGQQVNCQMRLKKTTPFTLVGKPKDTLRKPGFMNFLEEVKGPTTPQLRGKGSYAVVKPSMIPAPYPLSPEFGIGIPKEVLIQGHVTVVNRPEKGLVAPPGFQKELQVHLTRSTPLDINGYVLALAENAKEPRKLMPPYNSNTDIYEIQTRIKEILNRFSNGIWLSKIPQLYKEAYDEDFNMCLLSHVEFWPHICVVEKMCSGDQRDILLRPAGKMPQLRKGISGQEEKPQLPLMSETAETKAPTPHGDVKQNIAAILIKYSSGLWANALAKIYKETYKAALPHYLLNNLDSLKDICSIDYISENPKKAILYAKQKEHMEKNLSAVTNNPIDENLQRPTMTKQNTQEDYLENITVPPLIIPEEMSPSVLVVELISTNEVVVRYVGKDYSAAQELMEDEMKDWYCQNPVHSLQIQSPKVGQVVAVPAEEDVWLRAQILSTEGNRIKVCYVDYGFNEIIENSRVYKLAQRFYTLPFQASKCRLAGLEAFCDDPVLVKTVESQTCGKIFAVEILEKSDIPLIILYDTSGEDDININASCKKALHDKSLELHLQVDALYTDVQVTNVCSDGTLYCQVPSKGLSKLSEALQKLENFFQHKVAEYSVSLPYCGMICLINYKGKWARVEITSVHSSRTLDIQFMDTGTVASVKVVELREIPSTFLREIIAIPPQALKCCLADHIGTWTSDAVLWLRDTVLNCPDCNMKVVKLDDQIAYIYLFTPNNFPDPDRSINRQITNTDLWKHQKDVCLSVTSSNFPGRGKTDLPTLSSLATKQSVTETVPCIQESSKVETALNMPSSLPLVQPQEQMDVFVSLACHPGYFILQSWKEMHNLEVLVEEMLLYYSTTNDRPVSVEKNKIYAAKVKNKWRRVLIKGILANGLVSVYELDYGKYELVGIQNVSPLVDMFRKLPFLAIAAQLAGVERQQWSEEASIVFRNHVEKKPLVAQVEAIIEGANPWDRKVVVYLVDTLVPDMDIWIHDIMNQYCMEMSKAT